MKNYGINPTKRTMSFGDLNCIALGESGRGRKEVIVPCTWMGDSKFISCTESRSGKLKLETGVDGSDGWIARISAKGTYTRDTYGTVYVQPQSQIELLTSAYGAYGDAGRIGTWWDFLFIIPDNSIVKVRPSGGASKVPPYYLYFDDTKVTKVIESELDLFLDTKGKGPLQAWIDAAG